jgi:hypothetical protein
MRGILHVIPIVCFDWCAAAVGMAIVMLAIFLINPFAGFDSGQECTDISGPEAKWRLETAWPSDVDPRR